MRTLSSRRSIYLGLCMAVIVCGTMTIASCGSSHSSTPVVGESTSIAPSVPSAPSSILPAPSSIPGNVQAPCSALKAALSISDLEPKNSGNWIAERQRIQTDAASDAALFSAASKGVPTTVVTALETLKEYSTWIGTTVANSATFEAATKAIKAYPDSVPATKAMASVDTWSRANC
jgi:hypothetical protein